MLQVGSVERIVIVHRGVDFRNRVDGLCGICRRELSIDPMSGLLVVFRNKSQRQLRVLGYNSVGYFLYESQMAVGRFPWWPKDMNTPLSPMAARELLVLLCGGNPAEAQFCTEWNSISG